MFVAGRFSSNVFKITPAGVITVILDAAGDEMGSNFSQATDLAVDADGNVYAACESPERVFKITPAGDRSLFYDDTVLPQDGDPVFGPLSIAIDGVGNVFIGGRFSSNVLKITPSGGVTQIIEDMGDGGGNMLQEVSDVAADDFGNAYVLGRASDNVFKISPDGAIAVIMDQTGDSMGNMLSEPLAIDTDANGANVVVVSEGSLVFKLDFDDDDDGVPNEIDECPGSGPNVAVGPTGRPLRDCNLDCEFNALDIQCIVDELLSQ